LFAGGAEFGFGEAFKGTFGGVVIELFIVFFGDNSELIKRLEFVAAGSDNSIILFL
jgi:hypothetical protein